MNSINRRSFLKSSILGAAGVSVGWSARSWAQVPGANSDIRVAVVGTGGRGNSHIGAFSKMKGARLVALCDADTKHSGSHAASLKNRNIEVRTFTDIREVLKQNDIDAISIATPNHWHSLMTIWACQAGKDVYVEKPISHNVWEGRKAVEASRKYNRIVQAGTQSRSNAALKEALEWVRSGSLGKIKVARGLCYKRRPSIGKVDGPQPIPESVDYDLWCGPAPKTPLMRKNLHYDWHWVWPTGNGDLGNQGIHQMDIARWALGVNELSPSILSVGGRLGYVDDGETANTHMIVHNYGSALLIFEVRGLPKSTDAKDMDKLKGQSVGNIIECEHGYLSGTTAFDNDGKTIRKFTDKGEEGHFENFITAVRERKRSLQAADILEGHLSSALCHTGNISHRLGKQESPEAIREKLKKDSAALETFSRMQEHLANNGVDIKASQLTFGVHLKMDPKKETFIGNRAANAMLTRNYRKPFVVPSKV